MDFFGGWVYFFFNDDVFDDFVGMNIIVKGSYVIIVGLRFYLGFLSGIKVVVDDVKIYDCYFDGLW